MKRIRKAVGYPFAICAVTSIGLALLPTAASAHATSTNITSGSTKYGHVEVNSNHKIIAACDDRSDNLGVYVEWYDSNGYHTVSDPDGNGGDCGFGYSDGAGNVITQFNGHSRGGASTGWRVP